MEHNLPKNLSLSGKVAVITGASKGIGAAIAEALAAAGAAVVLSSRRLEAVEEVAETIRRSGGEASAFACHVGDELQLEALVEHAVGLYGGIDILVNNAATNPAYGPLQTADGPLFDKIMQINLRAPFLLSNLVYPHLRTRGGGAILHIGSVEGSKPSPGMALYSVSKAALEMLTKAQAREWGGEGIRVNALCPGLVQTRFSAAIWQNESLLRELTDRLPLGRMAQPGEMAALALLLCSGAGSYLTGATFAADGGWLLT